MIKSQVSESQIIFVLKL